jgi:hypothetical protein
LVACLARASHGPSRQGGTQRAPRGRGVGDHRQTVAAGCQVVTATRSLYPHPGLTVQESTVCTTESWRAVFGDVCASCIRRWVESPQPVQPRWGTDRNHCHWQCNHNEAAGMDGWGGRRRARTQLTSGWPDHGTRLPLNLQSTCVTIPQGCSHCPHGPRVVLS